MLTCPHCSPALPDAPPRLEPASPGGLACARCERLWPVWESGKVTVPCLLPEPHDALAVAQHTAALWDDPRRLGDALQATDPLLQALAGGLLAYAQNHFGRWCAPPLPDAEMAWLGAWLPAGLPDGPLAVLGCGPGGELAALVDHPALCGREVWLVDANLLALVWGKTLAAAGAVELPFRDTASTISWREARLDGAIRTLLQRSKVVCADIQHPPWPAAQFAAIVSCGLLDSVADPPLAVQQIAASLRPQGVWLNAAPWNWQEAVTRRDRQLHSLHPDMGALLSGQVVAGLGQGLALEARADGVPWTLTVHPRLRLQYMLEVLRLRRVA